MKALFPYQTLVGDVTLAVEHIRIDDKVAQHTVQLDERTIDLRDLEETDWEVAVITLVAKAPPSEIADRSETKCVALAECGYANNRVSALLTEDPSIRGLWKGHLELERAYWYAAAELRVHITGTVGGVSDRIIGSSELWWIQFNDLADRPINGAIKITWVDFGDPDDDRAFLRKHQDNYAYLSIDPDEPQLLLNRGFAGLEQLLADRRRRGLEKALHDQTRTSIADKTWFALFNAALAAVESNDDASMPEWPTVDWQRKVLESLLARMYPEKDPEEALVEVWASYRSPDTSATVQEQVGPASNAHVRAPRLLREGIRSFANGQDEPGENR